MSIFPSPKYIKASTAFEVFAVLHILAKNQSGVLEKAKVKKHRNPSPNLYLRS